MDKPKMKFPLRSKTVILISVLLLVLFSLSRYLVMKQEKDFLTRSLITKGKALIDNFTLYCQNAFLTGDELNIEDYVEVLLKDREIKKIYIVLKNNTYFLNTDHSLLGQKYIPPEHLISRPEDSYHTFRENGTLQYQFYKPVHQITSKGRRIYMGTAYVELSTQGISRRLNRIMFRLMIIFLSLFILGIIGAIFLSGLLVNPIQKLIRGVNIIGNGNLRYKISLPTRDEIEDLAREFNKMTKKLLLYQNKVVRQKVVHQELLIAKGILSQIIPSQLANVAGHRIFHFYRPSHFISGDYFNLLKVNNSEYLFIIADVSGKGIPAALLMAILHTVIMTLEQYYNAPIELMKHINLIISRLLKKGDFITAQLGLLDIRKEQIQIISAGHEYPLYINFSRRNIQYIKPAGIPIGLFEHNIFESRLLPVTHRLEKNSLLLFFTDGLRNIKRLPFNNKKLIDFITSLLDLSNNYNIFENLLIKKVRLKNYRDDLTLLGIIKD
ncbi:MAG: SpoIIE family protein phosphatase [bacterium]|nr:SpoIIE family protein phosphatase [bacterium]